MMVKWEHRKNLIIAAASFIIPMLIMLLICIMGGFYPFGETSILIADMKVQFVDYIGYMKYIFFGNNDFLYSFSKTFGGDMTGFASYYLFNPFFLLLLFFPNSELPLGIIVILILMCGFSGLTFHLLLKEVYDIRFASLIFSTSYALMGYYVAYINCIHYFFSTIMFPIVILGLYRTIKSKKINLVYIFSVALCVCSNYYIGYMILIFTAVFFMCFIVNSLESVAEIKKQISLIWCVLYSTLLGVFISAFSLFSVVYSLKDQKSSGISLSLTRNFKMIEFFSGLYSNSFHGNISDGLPIIYSGIIPTIFLFLFFMNKKIKIKEKILVASLLLFMIMGFYIDALNVAWHGFAHPIGFPYRNSFIFSFIVLFFGYKGFIYLKDDFKEVYTNYIVVIFILYSIVLIVLKSRYVTFEQIAVTSAFVMLSIICIVMLKKGRKYVVPAIAGIILLQIIDLSYNGYCSLNSYYGDTKEEEKNSEKFYSDYVIEQEEIVQYINSQDNSFFRMDKLYRRDHNDAMLFGYNGLSHFSSCENDFVKRFMGKLGYRDNGNWAFFSQGSSAFAESFMGLKYLVSQIDETCMPFEKINVINDKHIYKNPYALPLGFGMSKDVENVDLSEKDPFIFQNQIASSFSDMNYIIYRPVKQVDFNTVNVIKDGNVYRKDDSQQESYIEYKYIADSKNFMFMYFDAPEIQKTEVYVNGMDKGNCFNMYDWSIRECGIFEAGEEVTVKVILVDDEIKIDNLYMYYQSNQVLESWYKDAKKTNCDVYKKTSSHLIMDIEADSDTDKFVFTIPYEKDWSVKVDGKKVETEKVLGALLAINIEEGKHTIDMRYIPRGLVCGSIVSLISLITTFCVFFYKSEVKTQGKIENKKK